MDHRRRQLLRRQSVTPAAHLGVPAALSERGQHVQVQRFSDGSRLLRPIEHRDTRHALWQLLEKVPDRKRSKQRHAQRPDALAATDELSYGFASRNGSGAHRDHDALGLRVARVSKQLIATARALGQAAHFVENDLRARRIQGIAGFARLKVRIWVLGGAAHARMVRAQRRLTVGGDSRLINQRTQVFVGEYRDLRQLMRGAEPVEEVKKRDA